MSGAKQNRHKAESAHLGAARLPPVPAGGRGVEAEEAMAQEEARVAAHVREEVLKEILEVLLVLEVAPVGDLDHEGHPLLAAHDGAVVIVARGAVRRVHAVDQLVLPAVARGQATADAVGGLSSFPNSREMCTIKNYCNDIV